MGLLPVNVPVADHMMILVGAPSPTIKFSDGLYPLKYLLWGWTIIYLLEGMNNFGNKMIDRHD